MSKPTHFGIQGPTQRHKSSQYSFPCAFYGKRCLSLVNGRWSKQNFNVQPNVECSMLIGTLKIVGGDNMSTKRWKLVHLLHWIVRNWEKKKEKEKEMVLRTPIQSKSPKSTPKVTMDPKTSISIRDAYGSRLSDYPDISTVNNWVGPYLDSDKVNWPESRSLDQWSKRVWIRFHLGPDPDLTYYINFYKSSHKTQFF